MRSLLIFGIIFLGFTACKSTAKMVSVDKKACTIFENNIKIVEAFYTKDSGYSLELEAASKFLEDITKLKPSGVYDYSGIGKTSELDLHKWKKWYKKNKHLLYWDLEEGIVRRRDSGTLLTVNN